MQGYQSTLPVPRHIRSSQLTTSSTKFRNKFGNWGQVVCEFKSAVQSAHALQPSLGTNISDVRVGLLKSVLRSNKLKGAANILQNFDLAAIYLIYVGRNGAWDAGLLDMPSGALDLVSVV